MNSAIQAFNVITGIFAILLALMITVLGIGLGPCFYCEQIDWLDRQHYSVPLETASWIGVAVASQLGLFLAPWAPQMKRPLRILIMLAMLPSLGFFLYAFTENMVGLLSRTRSVIEGLVISAFVLSIYVGQVILIVRSFVTKAACNRPLEGT